MEILFDPSIIASDPNYISLRDNPKYYELREYCENLWNKFSTFADDTFRSDFANQLHSRFWEMYLGNRLMDCGFALVQKQSNMGPDLKILVNNSVVWIEATASEEGCGIDAVPNIFAHSRFNSLPQDKIILRFTNSIMAKIYQFNCYINKGIVNSEDSYIIAVNGGGIGLVSFDADPIPAILRSVYPIGDFYITYDKESGKFIDSGFYNRQEVIKNSGSSVSTNIFIDPNNTGISGILYSQTAIKFPLSQMEEDFLFIHNLLANNPLNLGWIDLKEEYWIDEEGCLQFVKN